jgi:hypothetical protein
MSSATAMTPTRPSPSPHEHRAGLFYLHAASKFIGRNGISHCRLRRPRRFLVIEIAVCKPPSVLRLQREGSFTAPAEKSPARGQHHLRRFAEQSPCSGAHHRCCRPQISWQPRRHAIAMLAQSRAAAKLNIDYCVAGVTPGAGPCASWAWLEWSPASNR